MSKWVEFPIASPQDLLNPQMKGRKPLYVHQHPQLGADLHSGFMYVFMEATEKRSGSQNHNAEAIWWVYLFSLFLVWCCWVEEGRHLAFCH